MDDEEIYVLWANKNRVEANYGIGKDSMLQLMAKAREDERLKFNAKAMLKHLDWLKTQKLHVGLTEEAHKKILATALKQERERILKELDKLIKYKDAQGEWCDYKAIKKLKAKLKEEWTTVSKEATDKEFLKTLKEGSG